MKRFEFDENSRLTDCLNTIRNEAEDTLELFFHPGCEILRTSGNESVIEHFAATLGKKVVFKKGAAKAAEVPLQRVEEIGFVEGKDVAEHLPPPSPPHEVSSEVKKRRFSLPALKLPKNKLLYLVGGGLVASALIVGSVFWFLPAATVKIFTEPQFKDAELAIVASAAASDADAQKGIVPLKVVDTIQEDSVTTKATGEKTIGTQAKGRVKIVNRDTNAEGKTFFKGTTIVPVSGSTTQFTLDSTATVAAAPLGCEADCPSAGVDVTAKTIGEQGNLSSGTVFRVGSADVNLVFAKNDTNFTGGTSKKVTVVSSEDQQKAKDEMLKKLEEKAKEALKKDDPSISIPQGGLESQVIEEIYDKKVDEEAAEFKLTMKAQFIVKSFSEEDLKDLLIAAIADSIPGGFKINRETSTVRSEIVSKTNGDLNILGKIKAALVPEINEQEVKKKIAGKGFGSVDTYLKGLANVSGFEVKISPSIFRIFGTMPFSTNRIGLEITQKE